MEDAVSARLREAPAFRLVRARGADELLRARAARMSLEALEQGRPDTPTPLLRRDPDTPAPRAIRGDEEAAVANPAGRGDPAGGASTTSTRRFGSGMAASNCRTTSGDCHCAGRA